MEIASFSGIIFIGSVLQVQAKEGDLMKEIIVVTDLGHFKAYGVSKNPYESPRLELLESLDIPDAHGKFMDKFTDAEGRFEERSRGTTVIATGTGEPHNVELEIKKKVIKRIANNINTLIAKDGCSRWYLAAAEKINNQIVENLDPSIKAKLRKNIKADLTKTAKSSILGYFEG
jgi:hypothetical protein